MEITKMHGLGNDFILIDDMSGRENDLAGLAKKLCQRRLSVGADGLIAACSSGSADVRMRIFNADGSEAEMCGNGIRCLARYVYDKGIVNKEQMSVETGAGIMKPLLMTSDEGDVELVRVDMGMPCFDCEKIPVKWEKSPLYIDTKIDGRDVSLGSVLMGVPHTVVISEDMSGVCEMGPAIEKAPIFPQKTNVNFVKIIDKKTIEMRTWERGVGETLACGTGATAAAALLHERGDVERDVEVRLFAGSLFIHIDGDGRCFMSGPAEYVFHGRVIF